MEDIETFDLIIIKRFLLRFLKEKRIYYNFINNVNKHNIKLIDANFVYNFLYEKDLSRQTLILNKIKKNVYRIELTRITSLISNSFVWGDTREDHNFWSDINIEFYYVSNKFFKELCISSNKKYKIKF